MIKKRSHVSFLFKLFSTGLILFLLFRAIEFDTNQFLGIISTVNVSLFILSLSGVIVVLAIKSFRWKALLHKEGIAYSSRQSLMAYFSAYAVGVVSPGRLGELVKVYNVRQDTGAGFIPAFRTTVGDRLFDLAILYLFGIAGAVKYFWGNASHDAINILASAMLLVMLIITFHLLFKWIRGKPRFSGNMFVAFISDCLGMLTAWQSWLSWLLTLLAYVIFFLTTWLLLRALEINIGIIDTGYVISIVGLVLLLPVSVAGFGTREVSLVFLLSIYGIENEAAISFSILQFIAFFVWGGLVGLFCWLANPVSMDILKEDARKVVKLFRRKKVQTLHDEP